MTHADRLAQELQDIALERFSPKADPENRDVWDTLLEASEVLTHLNGLIDTVRGMEGQRKEAAELIAADGL